MEKKFNLAFNIFLVCGMFVAVVLTTVFKLRQPDVKAFMLILAGFGSLMGVVNTVMSANGHILTFVFGFLDVLIGTLIYLDNGIYGNFALHAFYFLPMQVIGFRQWRRRGAGVRSGEGVSKVRARRLDSRQRLILVIGIAALTAALYGILFGVDSLAAGGKGAQILDRKKIFLDSLVMSLNIAGQVLLSFAFVEQWYVWIFVNVSSIVLWSNAIVNGSGSGNAPVMLFKYVFYLLNSLNGLRIWLKLSRTAAPSDLDN
ncbi:MAG: nicotinamide riboside transporter PnuC [Candidatus Cryptobacteroides sp.]